MRIFLIISVSLFAFLHSQTGSAAFVAAAYTGEITSVFEAPGYSNPYGVSVGSAIYLSVTYDDLLVSPSGTSVVSFEYQDGQHLFITVGTETFTEWGDYLYGSGYPQLTFLDGSLIGINYSHPFDNLSGPGLGMNNSNILRAYDGYYDDATGQIVTYWDISGEYDFSSVIPLPPAVWLFGSAILGLTALTRRKLDLS